MHMNRRELLKLLALCNAGSGFRLAHANPDELCSPPHTLIRPEFSGLRIAAAEASRYRAYRSKFANRSDVITWIQIDLGKSRSFDSVRLYPAKRHLVAGDGFPLRFRIECSDDPGFHSSTLVADRTTEDCPNPEDQVIQFSEQCLQGQYVRVTATRLSSKKTPSGFLEQLPSEYLEQYKTLLEQRHFSLAKVEVLAGEADLAVGKIVSVDPEFGNDECAQQITRRPRPQGEGLLTDNKGNVTSPDHWLPVPNVATAPRTNVTLCNGLFARALDANADYLLESFSTDELLRPFRLRAGKYAPEPTRELDAFWDTTLAGSNAGRFLMGAANCLRWGDYPELKRRVNIVIDGIEECRQPNGYIMGYPEELFFSSERGAYVRSWLTHGLIDAGLVGNIKALSLLRGYYDWYNQHPEKSRMLRGCVLGGQGMVANTRLFFSPVGRDEDLQVIQQFFQENYWLDELAAQNPDALWQYPYDRPHAYLLTNLEAYLDLYRATGDARYLKAVQGGWNLFRENWQAIGGSISLIELAGNVPKSNPLYERTGETCSSAFWILLNHRLHLLDPLQEKYVAEIEKSIYNVILANQGRGRGIRYHTTLLGKKEAPTSVNTCCEGQGTRILGSLAEYVYSVEDRALYVNLFECSRFSWVNREGVVEIEQQTKFPYQENVEIRVKASHPIPLSIYIRVPSWAANGMCIRVNDVPTGYGAPGTYVLLHRAWGKDDKILFVLPISFKFSCYQGSDQVVNRSRFFLQYGPILMAAKDQADEPISLTNAGDPGDLVHRLKPVKGKPLHFTLLTDQGTVTFLPYYELEDEFFTCAPIVETPAPVF